MSFIAAESRTLGRLLPPWWLFLITGVGWMLLAVIALRFDYTTVSAISNQILELTRAIHALTTKAASSPDTPAG